MKKIFYYIFFICLSLALASCAQRDSDVTIDDGDITVYGNVIDRETGEPLYNVLIQEKNRVGGSSVTGYDGNYEYHLPLNGKSNEVFTLVASKSLYSEAEYELRLNEADKGRQIRVDFQLETGVYHFKGKVTDQDGRPLSNVLIKETYQNTGSSVYTDNSGQYSLDLFPYSESINKYILNASKSDYYSDEYTISLGSKDYGRISTVNFQLESSVQPVKYCYIEATVVGMPGSKVSPNKPIQDVLIEVRKHKTKDASSSEKILVASKYTNEQGKCTIKQPIDEKYPYYTYSAEKSNWYFREHTVGNTWYNTAILQIIPSMENQTFKINWQGYYRN